MIFEDRRQAGQMLADKLLAVQEKGEYNFKPGVVVALPRGGVPVAYEIAMKLRLPLDVCIVRKVGVPGQPELAVASVAEGKEIFVNEDVRRTLRLTPEDIERLAEPKHKEITDRVYLFRAGKPPLDVAQKTVILVDDGIATGATVFSALQVLKKRKAEKLVLALPVAPHGAALELEREADKVVVLSEPDHFGSVGQWYRDFGQVSDREVRERLEKNPSS